MGGGGGGGGRAPGASPLNPLLSLGSINRNISTTIQPLSSLLILLSLGTSHNEGMNTISLKGIRVLLYWQREILFNILMILICSPVKTITFLFVQDIGNNNKRGNKREKTAVS